MADTKITALTAITTVDPAVDVLPIVDVSDTTMAASGTTKKITSNQILGAGGTATLASATITGDLTVASSILKVTGGNVGINTASPTNTSGYKTLEIVGTGVNTGGMIRMKSSDSSVSSLDFVDNNGRGIFAVSNHNLRFGCNDIEQYRIQPLGIFTWYDGAGGTRMTLNATGLGVGGSPITRLTVNKSSQTPGGTTPNGALVITDTAGGNLCLELGVNSAGNPWVQSRNSTTGAYYDLNLQPNGGNVGVGVTPSAWNTLTPVQVKNAAFSGYLNNAYVTSNAYYDATFKYIAGSSRAALYNQASGVHSWYYDSGTQIAGQNTTFTQAMTLTASGDLLVGTTSAGANGFRCYLSTDSGTTKWSVGPYVSATNFAIVASGSAGGVYLNGTTATSWTALSDERFKDIIEPISNAVTKVGSLRAVIGKLKSDESGTRKTFLIAQDVQTVLPEAVDSSNPDKLGLAYTDVIPLLVAAIKELSAEVNALKNA